ncbi:MAG: L-rhamnose mutarotase [Oscillospiraceae bacterium]|nr:L-rhamnose mutarotase [Oscillospiraceae bacterium]
MEVKIQRRGQIIGVKKEKLAEYLDLHRNIPADIQAMLLEAGFQKLEIYVQELPNGDCWLFQYNEQVPGNEKALDNDRYREWLRVTGLCQQPLPGETFWKDMDLAYTLHPECQ